MVGATNGALDGVLAAVASAELAVAGWFARRALQAFRARETDLRGELVEHGLRVGRGMRRLERRLAKLAGQVRRNTEQIAQLTSDSYLPHDRRRHPPEPDSPRRRWDDP